MSSSDDSRAILTAMAEAWSAAGRTWDAAGIAAKPGYPTVMVPLGLFSARVSLLRVVCATVPPAPTP